MNVKTLTIVIIITILLCFLSVSRGTEIHISYGKHSTKGYIEISIMIDQVDNLAGVKLIIKYDSKNLVFKKGIKTKYSEPLTYVINSKNAGKLIIVMAGAHGISGKEFPLIKLIFNQIKKSSLSWIKIVNAEFVSEKLESIRCKIPRSEIRIK